MLKFIKRKSRWFLAVLFLTVAVALAVLSAFLFTEKPNDEGVEDALTSSVVYEDEVSSNEEPPTSQEEITETVSSEETPPEPKVTVINAYLPYEKQSYASGASFNVVIAARPDSSVVTATFNGQTINLEKQNMLNDDGTEPEFVNFNGTFVLPSGNESNLNLGKVKFYAEWNGHSDTYYSPSITCLRDPQCDRTTVVEVVAESAETFFGNTTDDNSDPRNSPLPKGTVDYKVGDVVYDKKSGKAYYNLRCGKRVYIDKNNPPDTNRYQVTTTYKGELPDVNQINFNKSYISGGHTYIAFDTDWKAPFAVSIEPQQYTNPAIRDFTVQSVTSQYVDIKFYYTAVISGSLALPDNPLFSRAQAIPQEGGAILRLYLKKTGGFYGWEAYYNSAGQLEFKFLNPKTATAANNQYGAKLNGITVLLDAGHGGRDPGALGLSPSSMPEAERNLSLAYKVKAELESIGATVVMTRTGNTAVTSEKRCSIMRNTAPDLCISIHHDSSNSASVHGASFYCFNAFSSNATTALFESTKSSGIYNKVSKGWHYFYMGRVTACPLVLIENGYISNPIDFETIKNDSINNIKAKNIVLGIADYFLSIN